MISALIFCAHLVFLTFVFTRKWQNESLSSAWINAGLIILLFSVGWSVTGMVAKALMEKEGFGIYFDRDTFSLVLLTIAEYFFYKLYYGKESAVREREEPEEQ